MAENKKQHYVPKTYLKRFANGKLFSVLNVENGDIYDNVAYGNQCYESYFYGTNLEWEKRLNLMEQQWGIVLDKVCAGEVIEESDENILRQFALYQYQRTVSRDQFNILSYKESVREVAKVYLRKEEISDEESESFFEEYAKKMTSPEKALEMTASFESVIADLKVIVIECKTKTKLISSDAPVICINPFEPHAIGFGCMGFLMFFPACDSKLVVIYDGKMYKANKNITAILEEEEIYHLNAYQYISAERIVYGKEKKDLDFVRESLKEERRKNRAVKPVQALGSLDSKLIAMSNKRIIHDCNLSFTYLSHEIRKIPLVCREAVPRIWEKGWQDKLRNKEIILPQIMRSHREEKEKPGLSIKEIKRGCRLMSNYAEKYWRMHIS